MRLSTDIRLPKNVTPIFPRRCIYSDRENPDSEAFVMASSIGGMLVWVPPPFFFSGRRYRVPFFKEYRARFFARTLGRKAITFALVLLALWFAADLLSRTHLRVLNLIGIILGTWAAWAGLEVVLPQRFDVTVGSDWIDYEFASAEYAAEFLQLNEAHVTQILT